MINETINFIKEPVFIGIGNHIEINKAIIIIIVVFLGIGFFYLIEYFLKLIGYANVVREEQNERIKEEDVLYSED